MRANYSYKLTSIQLTDTNPISFLTPLMQIFYFGNTHDLAKIYRKRRPAYELSPTAPCTVPGLGLEFGKLLANVLLNN